MARRPTKLEVHDHRVTCPHCRAELVFYSLMEQLILIRRICAVCKREMLIENGSARKLPVEGAKKPPKQVRSNISKAQDRKKG